jgi:hypothetical protein
MKQTVTPLSIQPPGLRPDMNHKQLDAAQGFCHQHALVHSQWLGREDTHLEETRLRIHHAILVAFSEIAQSAG